RAPPDPGGALRLIGMTSRNQRPPEYVEATTCGKLCRSKRSTSSMAGLRIGLVGAGRIGAMHARNLSGLAGVGRLTITDLNQAQAKSVADEVGADLADSVSALF